MANSLSVRMSAQKKKQRLRAIGKLNGPFVIHRQPDEESYQGGRLNGAGKNCVEPPPKALSQEIDRAVDSHCVTQTTDRR